MSGFIHPQIEFKHRKFHFTKKQKHVIDSLLSDRSQIVFLSGPAGCTKTYLAIYAALSLLRDSNCEKISYVRTIIESGERSVGTLPGGQEEKLMPFTRPLDDKLYEILSPNSYAMLNQYSQKYIESIPVNYLRGSSWENEVIVFDEAQNARFKELTTAMTRVGHNTKLFLCGDPMQSDINGKSGFVEMADMFNNEMSVNEGIRVFNFDESDIKRSELVKYIVKTISSQKR
tara:strand:+ start:23964 stop:24653 length:690 start_codon:yes stop_codon:yes gene_type:complete